MDSCFNVEREADKVVNKFKTIGHNFDHTLQNIIDRIDDIKNNHDGGSSGSQLTAPQITKLNIEMDEVRATIQKLQSDHRDLHSSVSKVGKSIDRHFTPDYSSCSREDAFSGSNEKILNQVICQHFYHQGMLDIAEVLAEEAGLTLEEDKKEPFSQINQILEALKERNVLPALEWAEKNRDFLEAQNSNLEFKLHQLQFIMLMQKGMNYQTEAMNYCRTYLTRFIDIHAKEIQNLMGMFIYLPQGLDSSPYAHYTKPTLWAEINELFMRDACALLGLSIDSPLSICVNAGCIALPNLLSIKSVMQQRQVPIWNGGKDELPIEIDIGPNRQYHSIFACPILRQQSSDSNPPMRLVCGHVISKDALNKLGNNSHKLKCPYCPKELTIEEAKQAKF